MAYALEEPIDLEHPGLIYVAHRREAAGDKAWYMDETFLDDGDCGSWAECRSAVNLPEADIDLQYMYWRSISASGRFTALRHSAHEPQSPSSRKVSSMYQALSPAASRRCAT